MKNKITYSNYQKMWNAFKGGIIDEEGWREFCDMYLIQILEENKDVMVRLKNVL